MNGVVYHLTEPTTWAEAQRVGHLTPEGFEAEGFVHCSTTEQLVGTIERHFPTAGELVLLELDLTELDTDLRWEESRPGETYPHLYRPIDVVEVRRALRWDRSPDGSVTLPDELGRRRSAGS